MSTVSLTVALVVSRTGFKERVRHELFFLLQNSKRETQLGIQLQIQLGGQQKERRKERNKLEGKETTKKDF